MLLSVCLIVRNEADVIVRCLSSVKPIASEILLLDTGSEDQTIELAESFGAQVYRMAWAGHFSRARNHLLAKARGRWVLFVDADEWLTREHARQLLAFLSEARPAIYSLFWRQDANLPPSAKAVLFPSGCGVSYLGRVHELPWDSAGKLPLRFLPQIELQHAPEISPLDVRKVMAARYLLSQDLAHPDPVERFHALRHWAQSEMILHNDPCARLYFEQAWALFLQLPPACAAWGQSVLAALLFLARASGHSQAWCYWRAIFSRYYPDYPGLQHLPLTI